MASRFLAKAEWHFYFDRIASALEGKRAQIEVTGLRLGDQIEARWVPLLGITYDKKNDLLNIALEGLDHLVRKPSSIVVDEGPDGLNGLEIVDADQYRQIVTLASPLRLPAPDVERS